MILHERLPKETARDFAIRVLRDNIISLELEPGCMVSENELASEMGLSRTPVREALIELSKSGIVEIFPQHGSMVSKIDYSKVEEASFMRRVLEVAVVQEACEVATPADIRSLDDNLSLQDLYLAREDREKLLLADNEFHGELFRICKKNLCYQLMRGINAHFDRVRQLSLSAVKNIRIVQDHHDILAAIREKRPDKAREAMGAHLTRFKVDRAAIREKYARFFAE